MVECLENTCQCTPIFDIFELKFLFWMKLPCIDQYFNVNEMS